MDSHSLSRPRQCQIILLRFQGALGIAHLDASRAKSLSHAERKHVLSSYPIAEGCTTIALWNCMVATEHPLCGTKCTDVMMNHHTSSALSWPHRLLSYSSSARCLRSPLHFFTTKPTPTAKSAKMNATDAGRGLQCHFARWSQALISVRKLRLVLSSIEARHSFSQLHRKNVDWRDVAKYLEFLVWKGDGDGCTAGMGCSLWLLPPLPHPTHTSDDLLHLLM